MRKGEREKLCISRTLGRISKYKTATALRLAESKKLFGLRVYAVDIHTHSNFSDGKGSVPDNYRYAGKAGLDFMFATDHMRIAQRRFTKTLPRASWGQEPSTPEHHIGLLQNNRVFPKGMTGTLFQKLQKARELGDFTWIPHPVGWFPEKWYSDEVVAQLWEAGDSFAMEIINGAAKVIRAYDQFDAKAVAVWDRLLCDGRKITAVGGSDAHEPYGLGAVWTGVSAPTLSASSIIKALNAGRCFASESSLVNFSCEGRPMGSVVRRKKGDKLRFRYRIADSIGIARVRIIYNGKTVSDIAADGQKIVEGALERKVSNRPGYYRVESSAVDDLRAFSTPIYVEPRP